MKQIIIFIGACILLYGCKGKQAESKEAETTAGTPVTITGISTEPLTEYIYLNATATFLQKNYVKANVNGYVQNVNTQVGKYVREGQLLFTLKTKEAQAIGGAVTDLDPDFKFSGINHIKATGHGYINLINHQVGDYVQDGEQLAIINDMNSFAFVMELPFELRAYVTNNKPVTVVLPDGTNLEGRVASAMPTVDPNAQAQSVIIKVNKDSAIPENLIVKVKILKAEHDNTQSLPKVAVLTNDVQSEYWIMKLLDSVTAAKVVVKKGIETEDRVEILSPVFTKDDKFLLTGNFGLPDTAKVRIIQPQ